MTESDDVIELKIVSDEDIEFLYEMLQEMSGFHLQSPP